MNLKASSNRSTMVGSAEETIDFRHPRQDRTLEGLPSVKGRPELGRYIIFADHRHAYVEINKNYVDAGKFQRDKYQKVSS